MIDFVKKVFCFGAGLLDCKRHFYRKRYILFVKDLGASPDRGPVQLEPGFTLRIITSYLGLEELLSGDCDARSLPIFSDIESGLKKGGVLFLVLAGVECAHASLVMLERDAAVSMDPTYKKTDYANAGYIGPCYTAQKYRGKGLYPHALSEICVFLKGRGMASALINTKTTNLASARGITKAGFKDIAKIRVSKFLFMEFQKKTER